MRLPKLVLFAFFIAACAQQPSMPPHPVKCPGVTSPDQQLRACVLSVGRHPNPPLHESRVEIRDMTGVVLATRDFKSPDGERARNVQTAERTPDSHFLAFRTPSSGGPRPW